MRNSTSVNLCLALCGLVAVIECGGGSGTTATGGAGMTGRMGGAGSTATAGAGGALAIHTQPSLCSAMTV